MLLLYWKYIICQERINDMEKKRYFSPADLAFAGMMIAVVFVSNYISVPTAFSRLHAANAVCLLAGMLFGGVRGAIIAGLGSALFDITFPAYVAEAWITFINKAAMALVCGVIVNDSKNTWNRHLVNVIGAVSGAVLYMALYMFKSYIEIRWVAPLPPETIPTALLGKLSSSSINALFAVIVAPLLYAALHPALKKAGLYKKMTIKG